MSKKLFCEISPLTYRISVQKNIALRNIRDIFGREKFAHNKSVVKLPFVVMKHSSTIRRVLGNVDMTLQENKAKNLALAAPKIDGILIYPGETFSLWKLVGKCKASLGYRPGLTISKSSVSSGVGGGMCQLSNLIHWMILHSPLEITEHHHHDGFDLFPDCDRRVPFGTGTSITYNYLDYRVKNTTNSVYQICVFVTDNDLCGELRSDREPELVYEIRTEGECFVREAGEVYRTGKVFRKCISKNNGEILWDRCIRSNHAKVMYDTGNLTVIEKAD